MRFLKLKLTAPLVFHVEIMFLLNNFQPAVRKRGRIEVPLVKVRFNEYELMS